MKHIIFVRKVGALVLMISVLFLIACQNPQKQLLEKELEKLQPIVATAIEKHNNTSYERISKEIISFLEELLRYEQDIQGSNPKKLDIELIESGLALASEFEKVYLPVQKDKRYRRTQVVLTMIAASYYFETGDISSSVEKVQVGIEGFDNLVLNFPEDIVIRALRAMSYASLPNIFEKWLIADEDFNVVFDYISTTQDINNEYERGIYASAIERADSFYKEHEGELALEYEIEALKKIVQNQE